MSQSEVEIRGTAERGFESVREAFAANFERHGDVGAAVCLYRDGRPVVDLWGGTADVASGRAWQRDTVVMVFSTTKGITAVVANLLAERGKLDLDAPVARYWPEFAAAGKADIPVRWLLAHRAGLAAVDGELTLQDVLDWDPVVAAIAAQSPNWEPGTQHGYHVRSYGWTVGEVVRRIVGCSLGRWFAEEIAAPLGLDIWIGLPAAEEPRCATLIPAAGDTDGSSFLELIPPDSLLARALFGPSKLFAAGYDTSWNRREIRAAEMPSSNGIANARSLARLYAATLGEVDGTRILSSETVEAMTTDYLTAEQRKGQPFRDRPDYWAGQGFGLGVAVKLSPAVKASQLGVAKVGAFGWPGVFGTWWAADPAEDMILIFMVPGGDARPARWDFQAAAYDAIAD